MLKSFREDAEEEQQTVRQDSGRPGRSLRWIRVPVQFVLMVAILAGAYVTMNRIIATRPEPVQRPARPTVYVVEATTARMADNHPVLTLYGEVQAAHTVELRPLVSGEIVYVDPGLKAGERVEKGDRLIGIDPFNYRGALSQANANLAQARASLTETEANIKSEQDQLREAQVQLDLARKDIARAESLVDSGTMTQKQVEDRRLILSQREQAVSQRRNNLIIDNARREQQQANIDSLTWKVEEAERNLQNVALKAPFSGIISSENVEAGRYVGVSDVVATLYDDESLEARFTLTDAQYGRIAADTEPLIGRTVTVRWVVGAQSYRYDAVIDRIAAEIASRRGGIEVVARIDPSAAPVRLRPGAFVELDVPDRSYGNSFRIPETALYDGQTVFVIEDGLLSRRPVDVAAYDGDDAILTGGIADGETVLTTHLTQADDGVRVRQTEPQATGVVDKVPGKGRRNPDG
jgi:RND family efflux transporter MFP subunit